MTPAASLWPSAVMVCSGCGTTRSDQQIAEAVKANPRMMSCCPERKMVPYVPQADLATTARQAAAAAYGAALDAAAKWHDTAAQGIREDARMASRLGLHCQDSGGTLDHYADLHLGHAENIRALPIPDADALALVIAEAEEKAVKNAAQMLLDRLDPGLARERAVDLLREFAEAAAIRARGEGSADHAE